MSIILIRHGKTAGNLEGRYIGSRTDEPLCEQGIEALRGRVCPPVKRVIASPLTRCLQTAAILYPDLVPQVENDFRECDFGAFEGKNYSELNGRADYQAWIDSGGTLPFPGGESQEEMRCRCEEAFRRLNLFALEGDSAIVAHGGTLMALMSAFALPPRPYFDYQVKNGEGFLLEPDGSWRRL